MTDLNEKQLHIVTSKAHADKAINSPEGNLGLEKSRTTICLVHEFDFMDAIEEFK